MNQQKKRCKISECEFWLDVADCTNDIHIAVINCFVEKIEHIFPREPSVNKTLFPFVEQRRKKNGRMSLQVFQRN